MVLCIDVLLLLRLSLFQLRPSLFNKTVLLHLFLLSLGNSLSINFLLLFELFDGLFLLNMKSIQLSRLNDSAPKPMIWFIQLFGTFDNHHFSFATAWKTYFLPETQLSHFSKLLVTNPWIKCANQSRMDFMAICGLIIPPLLLISPAFLLIF